MAGHILGFWARFDPGLENLIKAVLEKNSWIVQTGWTKLNRTVFGGGLVLSEK